MHAVKLRQTFWVILGKKRAFILHLKVLGDENVIGIWAFSLGLIRYNKHFQNITLYDYLYHALPSHIVRGRKGATQMPYAGLHF